MKQIIFTVLAFGILSCNSLIVKNAPAQTREDSLIQQVKGAEQKDTLSKDLVEIDPSKVACVPTAYVYGDNTTDFSPGTFGKISYVYNSGKPGAKVIDSLLFNTSVNILAEYPEFFLVCSPKAKVGYIKKTDLYTHSLFWGLKMCTYLTGFIKYGTDDNTSCRSSTFQMMKIDERKTIIDVYKDSIMGKEYEIKQIYNSALKNSEALFYVNYHCYSEIGVVADLFVVDNGKKLSRLVLAVGSGDGGFSDISTVYLPITITNGKKILLAKNGVLSVDVTTGKVDTYTYPPDCGIPIEELVVVENKSVEMLWDDKNGGQKYNADGTQALKISDVEIDYYQWTGTILKKVKTVKL